MKKALKFCFVGVVWSALFLGGMNLLFMLLWNFNLFHWSDWKIIALFWNSGGVIRSASDFAFLLLLVLCFTIWIWGWKKALKINVLAILMKPLEYYRKYELKKYGESSRIVLKNIGFSAKTGSDDEIIKTELKKIAKEIDDSKEVPKIREVVNERISDIKK